MWRGRVRYFSTSTLSSPKLADASRLPTPARPRSLARIHHAHALAAAAGAGLEQHRVADAVGLAAQQRGVLVLAVIAGHQRHRGLFHQLLGRAAHRADGRRRRADEDEAGLGAGAREVGVLGQEAVARVDGLGAGFPSMMWSARR
jgi:hypothetical protein